MSYTDVYGGAQPYVEEETDWITDSHIERALVRYSRSMPAQDVPSLDDVYQQIPSVGCRGLCVDSCGPISMSRQEEARLLARGVSIPGMAEASAALEGGADYYCPALVEGRCSVYDDRPTICRLWGATESMPCPHGCSPDDPLTQAESYRILRLAAEAGGGMVDSFDPTRS